MATRKKAAAPVAPTVPTSLVLRCCNPDMTSRNGFVWPDVGGIATATDWKDNTECGNGLHGWLYGQGDHSSCDYWTNDNAKWLVVRVADSDIRMLGGKCKFKSGEVVFVGEKSQAAGYIIANEPKAATVAVIGAVLECGEKGSLLGGALSVLTGGNSATITGGYSATITGGNFAKITGGNFATITGGNSATITGGDSATITGGNSATITGGDSAKITGGNFATITGGYFATITGGYSATITGRNFAKITGGNCAKITGGDSATITGGDFATITGGDCATITGGNCATITGGDFATITGGNSATITGGYSAVMNFQYWDGKRTRVVTAYVGEDGILPNVAYKLDANHKVVTA